jgi:hypothetical protein
LYRYGDLAAAYNGAGRIIRVEDESGISETRYGKLGETVWESGTIKTLDAGRGMPVKTAVMEYMSNYLGQTEKIVYLNGEEVRYGYDSGGQIKKVTGSRMGTDFEYVKEIGYDEWGQRAYIEYGNNRSRSGGVTGEGVKTYYKYDENRRWLEEIKTMKGSAEYQKIKYDFDKVGNVLGYTNEAGRYATSQNYSYDELYQITGASGQSVQCLYY